MATLAVSHTPGRTQLDSPRLEIAATGGVPCPEISMTPPPSPNTAMPVSMVSNVRRWRRLGATTVGDDSMIWSVIVITSPPSKPQHGPGRQGPTSRLPADTHERSPANTDPQDLRPLGW